MKKSRKNLHTYRGYVLDIDLNNDIIFDKDYEKIIYYLSVIVEIPDSKWTLRMAEVYSDIPRSSLHRFIHEKLPDISAHLYGEVVKQMEWNIHHQRHNKM